MLQKTSDAFTGINDADILHNSGMINLNMLGLCHKRGIRRLFFSSSACVYPEYNQSNNHILNCSEDSVYPAAPDSDYGWEKLFSERMYMAFHRNKGMEVRIARYHNIFGPLGSWNDGREKAPATLCRKIASTADNGEIEIWGDGNQIRSFLRIDECIEGTLRLMRSGWTGPVNLGSDEQVSINQPADMVMAIAGKNMRKIHIQGPEGVRARNSDNRLIYQKLGWRPSQPLIRGLEKTYAWINGQLNTINR
ncbi:MAG: NAD-dependent epimerase/dehydratase family protein [Pseudomonadota bacterium]